MMIEEEEQQQLLLLFIRVKGSSGRTEHAKQTHKASRLKQTKIQMSPIVRHKSHGEP